MRQQRAPLTYSRRPTQDRYIAIEIVLIDQAPLRRTIAADCAAAMTRLEQARIGWHNFERQDKPAFVRWRARQFGALLSDARDIEDQIRHAQNLVHQVEMEMRRGFQNAHTAYQRVMFRRENPGLEADKSGESQPSASESAPLSDFEKEALFQEWVQRFLGTNPDKMDDDAYATTFEVFKSHMFFGPRDEPRLQNVRKAKESARVAPEQEDEEGEEEMKDGVDARVKELYRKLVRRLHPDLRADGSADVSSLWHEVQEAYLAGDVARMEILLALGNIQSNRLDDETSLSQMRSVLAELNRSTRALEKSLLEARGEDAWDFARSGPSDDLRVRVERQLKSELAARTNRRDMLAKTIADWARGPVANRKVIPLFR